MGLDQEKTPLIPGPPQATYPVTDSGYPPSTGYPTGYPPAPAGYASPTGEYPPQPQGYAAQPSYNPQVDPSSPYPPTGYPPQPFTSAPPPGSLPPPYNPNPIVPNAAGLMVVPCRVCVQPIEFTPKPNLSAVRCNKCHHATQVGPPPAGKKFILCQCNSLLTVSVTAKAATCPKADCKRTIILAPEAPGKSRAFCAHCNTLLTYNSSSAVVICPKCRGRSVVSRTKLNSYIVSFFIMAFIFIALGVGLTVSSYVIASDGGGVYFVFWGLVLAGVIMLIRAATYVALNRGAHDARIVPV